MVDYDGWDSSLRPRTKQYRLRGVDDLCTVLTLLDLSCVTWAWLKISCRRNLILTLCLSLFPVRSFSLSLSLSLSQLVSRILLELCDDVTWHSAPQGWQQDNFLYCEARSTLRVVLHLVDEWSWRFHYRDRRAQGNSAPATPLRWGAELLTQM